MPTAASVAPWTLGDRLRKARELGTDDNQQQFASRIGVSRNTVVNYENPKWLGKRKAIVLHAWANETGFNFAWLSDIDTADSEVFSSSGCTSRTARQVAA